MAKSTLRKIVAFIGMFIIALIGIAIAIITGKVLITLILTLIIAVVFSSIVLRKNIAEKAMKKDTIYLNYGVEYASWCRNVDDEEYEAETIEECIAYGEDVIYDQEQYQSATGITQTFSTTGVKEVKVLVNGVVKKNETVDFSKGDATVNAE